MESSTNYFPELSDREERYDESSVYKAEPEDIIQDDPISDLPLYRQPENKDGAFRAQRKGGENTELTYESDTVDYTLRVHRLVWVDGWRETSVDQVHKDDMTLAVLKLRFTPKTSDKKKRVSFASVELRFRSEEETGTDPEVVAWGPFHGSETWNRSVAHRTPNNKVDGRGSVGGGSMGSLSLGGATETGTSWYSTDFDRGDSMELFNTDAKQAKPYGVKWLVQQNQTHGEGITPEIRLAVLITRPSKDPYRVELNLRALTGTVSKAIDRAQRKIGLRGGKGHVWRATPHPGKKDHCYAEGKDIVKSIDIDNLGKLVSAPDSRRHLDPNWLNKSDRFEVPAVNSSHGGEAPEAPDPELLQGTTAAAAISELTVDSSRTTQLETRATQAEARIAQAETRIAAQDQLLFNMQQKILALEQAVTSLKEAPE